MRRPQPKNDNRESNVVVIAAGCMAAFAFVMLFLCCCLRGRRNKDGPKNGQRDDRPLLNFCSSDLSIGSSNSKFNNDLGNNRLGNSIRNDFSSMSSVNNLSIRSGTILDEGRPSDAKLPLPPGRATQLPLPLPPGRVAPPPPEPPSPPPPPPLPPPPPPPANTTIPKPPPALPIHKPPLPPPTRNGLPPPPAPNPPAPRAPPPPKICGWPPPTPLKPVHATKPPKIGSPPFAGNETNKIREVDSQKAKLKPFFWDKVSANTDHSMVWHEIKAGSFQFNEEMMENLFGYTTLEKKIDRKRDPSGFEGPQFIQLIDAKKAQNLSILLKALNVTTEEICDAINEGNELPIELIETLLKLAPTTEEELKLRLFSDDLSELGPAERFLKVVVDVPFAFKRLESLLFMCSLQEEVSSINESLSALEVACKELKNCRLFLKLLEAVLKTGNRMNNGTFRGGAQAFKLDTLLKLSDVKGTDGKTTLLHFVVLEIIRSEGIRAARRLRESHSIASVKTEDLVEDPPQETADQLCSLGLQVVSDLSNELANVRKAALIDGDTLTAAVSKVGFSLKKSKDFLKNEMSTIREESEFYDTLDKFLQQAEHDVTVIQEEEKRIMSLVKSTADYFHGNSGKDEGLRLFMIVRDFLVMLDKVCKEVKNLGINPIKIPRKEAPSALPRESHQPPSAPA